jgi:hypothetical protein
MPLRLTIFVTIIGLTISFGIIELVRRRMLREEYSFIWLLTGFTFVLLAIEGEILVWLSNLVGIVVPVNMLFFLGLIFTMLLCLYFSLRISSLTTQVKNLAQKIALLEAERGRTANSVG